MINKHINACIESCLNDLRTSKNKKIKDLMKRVEAELPSVMSEEGMFAFMKDVLGKVLMQDLEGKEMEYFIQSALEMFLADIIKMKTIYVFDISLNGLEKELNRTLKMSSVMKLSDLGYTILAAFRAEASHLFNFEIEEERYACDMELDLDDFDEGIILASEVALADLALKKKIKFTFTYDYGENYEFIISLQDVIVDNDFELILGDSIIKGNGYGIWENAHYELDMYYKDKAKFNAFLKENGLDEEDYPIEVEFNVEDCNEDIAENLYAIKLAYEADEEEFEDLLM